MSAIDTYRTIQRMDGLVDLVSQHNLEHYAQRICTGLLKEGFDVQDIMDFFNHHLSLIAKQVDEDLKVGNDGTMDDNPLKSFVESIAYWMQGDQVYDVKKEANQKILEARNLLETLDKK